MSDYTVSSIPNIKIDGMPVKEMHLDVLELGTVFYFEGYIYKILDFDEDINNGNITACSRYGFNIKRQKWTKIPGGRTFYMNDDGSNSVLVFVDFIPSLHES